MTIIFICRMGGGETQGLLDYQRGFLGRMLVILQAEYLERFGMEHVLLPSKQVEVFMYVLALRTFL